MRPVSPEIRDVASLVVPHAERPRFADPLLIRTRCRDTSSKANLWTKSQHEGVLTPPCIIRIKAQDPHTARQVACHPVNNSGGKRRYIPPHKTRPDSPVPTLQGPCGRSPKQRGSLSFLPPLDMRPSATAQTQWSQERPRQLQSIPHLSEAPGEVP